jgi:hypothetical protein
MVICFVDLRVDTLPTAPILIDSRPFVMSISEITFHRNESRNQFFLLRLPAAV